MILDILTQILFAHLWQGLLLLPIIMLIGKYIAKEDATLKHSLWTGALVLMFVMPFMTFVDLPRYTSEWAVPAAKQDVLLPATPYQQADLYANIPTIMVSEPVDTEQGNIDFSTLAIFAALFIWIAGSLNRLRLLASDYLYTRELKNLNDLDAFPSDKLPAHWPRQISVMTSSKIKTPMMTGFLKPFVVIPRSFLKSLPQKHLWSILFHELAHIERRDQWTALLQQLLMAVLWWSPWAHLAASRMRRERELACDDIAVERTGNASAYAKALITGSKHIAYKSIAAHSPNLALGVFHRQNELKERIMRLLNTDYLPTNKLRGPLSLMVIAILTVGSLAISFATPGYSFQQEDDNSVNPNDDRYGDDYDPIQAAFVETGARGTPGDLEKLLGAGADINKPSPGDGTALMLAVKAGRMDNINHLISRGADVNVPSHGDGNALIIATKQGRMDIIDLLISRGADVNMSVSADGNPLILAVRKERMDIVDHLISHGADVNQASIGDGNPLIAASAKGNVELITHLLGAGADINAVVRGDETPLITAARRGKMTAVVTLVEAGADTNLGAMDREQCRTPLSVSANHPKIREYLVDNGATSTECS